MIDKSCYTCYYADTPKGKFPCDKCHDLSNWIYKYNVGLLCLAGVVLIVFGIIVIL